MNIIEFEFKENDLLSFNEIELLIVSDDPNDIAIIVAKKLINYYMYNNGDFYRFDYANVLFIREDDYNNDKMVTMVTSFISQSNKNLSNEQREILKLKYPKKKIYNNKNLLEFLPQLKNYLTNNKINFCDPHLSEIHFQNGYYDFNLNKFQPRVRGKHYINVYIERNFETSSEEDIKRVMDDITKIYPIKEDRDYLLMTYAIAFTGYSCSEQTLLFLLGLGSSGKSTVLESLKLAFQEYVFTLPKDTFSKGNTKIDKILNTFRNKPWIRLAHINEPEDTKMNETLFKDHIDGKIQTTSLYREGANDFEHYSKTIITANTMPNIKIDSGTGRRLDAFTHKSTFTKDHSKVDISKNIYYADTHFLKLIKNDEKYLNALCTIIFNYGYNWITNEKIFKQTENFNDTKDAIISSNDIIQDFIDKAITITNIDSDRIGKEAMYHYFKSEYPKSLITPSQLMNQLKEKGLIYKAGDRCDRVRGCYVGIIFGEKEKTDNPLEYGIIPDVKEDYKSKFEEENKKYEELLKQYEDLEKKYKKLKRKEKKNKAINKPNEEEKELSLDENLNQLEQELFDKL